jgi:5-formyltetrahydrofolate cyclo-ligase
VRDCLKPQERDTASSVIINRVLHDYDWMHAATVMVYMSCRSEVSTEVLVQEALKVKKHVMVPCIPDGSDDIIPVAIQDISDVSAVCRYGMLQPRKELCQAFAGTMGVIVVPGVVFSRSGARVGSGKGYFDVLLARHFQAVKIGLAFECQMVSDVPVEPHDVMMDKVITEQNVYVTKQQL